MSSSVDNVGGGPARPHHERGHAGVGAWEHGANVPLLHRHLPLRWKVGGGVTR